MPTECKSGVGRIVWGNPLKGQQKKDPNTKQVILKDGQPVIQHSMGVAFPKAEFQQMVWPAMSQEVMSGYPSGQVPSKFAWKYIDGDSVDGQGQPYSRKEGYAGNIILTITSNTGFPPPVYKFNPATRNYDQVAADGIKTGDFVVVGLSFQVHIPTDRTHTPSLYVNPQAIELVGYGAAIMAGADPMELFGGQQYQLPAGASLTPISGAPSNVGMPGMPGQMQPQQQPMQQPGIMPGQMPGMQPFQAPGMMPQQQPLQQMVPQQFQQPQQPGMMPGQLPPPATDFVPNAGMQQPGMMPGQMPQQQPGNMNMMPGQMPPR